MADSLGAVLAGINSGVGNGLNIYKTLRDDERSAREERRAETRQAIDDERWALGEARQVRQEERQIGLDAAGQKDRDRTFELREKTLKFNQEEALRDNAAAERRHQEAMGLSRQRLATANNKNDIAIRKRMDTLYGEMNTELGAVFQGENGMQNFTELANTKPTYLAAIAHKLGGDINPDDLQGVTATMGRNKDGEVLFMLSKKDADGKDTMWDPDGDGQPGYAVSARAVSGMYGGINGIESVDTATTKASLADEAERTAAGVEAEAQKLKTTAEQQGAQVESARVALADAQNAPPGKHAALADSLADLNAKIGEYTSRREAPPALLLSQRDAVATAQKAADAEYDAANVAPLRQSLGDEVQRGWDGTRGNQGQGKGFYAARDKVTGAPSALEAEQAARAKAIATSEASLGNIVKERGITEERAVQTQARADGVRAAWGTVQQGVSALPFAQQRDALRASEETFNVSPQLAARYPGKNLATATDLMRKDRTAFIDKLVGAVDIKTKLVEGKMYDLTGGKANLRAVLTAMGDETLMALSDHTGSLEGSLQKAAQKALEIGKPEAVPYILYADANALDSAGAVALMQDKALMAKEPKERFKLAAEAMDLVKAGKADTPVSALGMVLQGR